MKPSPPVRPPGGLERSAGSEVGPSPRAGRSRLTSPSVEDLPEDLWDKIVRGLPDVDKASALSISRAWHHLPVGRQRRLERKIQCPSDFFSAQREINQRSADLHLVERLSLPTDPGAQMAILPRLIDCVRTQTLFVSSTFSPPPLMPFAPLTSAWGALRAVVFRLRDPTDPESLCDFLENAPTSLADLTLDISIECGRDYRDDLWEQWGTFSSSIMDLESMRHLKKLTFAVRGEESLGFVGWPIPSALPPFLHTLELLEEDRPYLAPNRSYRQFLRNISTLTQLRELTCDNTDDIAPGTDVPSLGEWLAHAPDSLERLEITYPLGRKARPFRAGI